MLFFLVSIFVLCIVALYYGQEDFSFSKLFKNISQNPTKTLKANAQKKLEPRRLEDLEDNVVDFEAFKESHQKHA